MKRTIIRSSVMALTVLAAAFGIRAQSQQYRAEIPFNFEARGKQHSAGEYKLEPISLDSYGAIGLRDLESGKMIVLSVSARPGTNNWDQPGTLTFVKVDGRYILKAVSTATFSLTMKGPKSDRGERVLASVEQSVKLQRD